MDTRLKQRWNHPQRLLVSLAILTGVTLAPAQLSAATLVDNLGVVNDQFTLPSSNRVAQRFSTTSELFVINAVSIIGWELNDNQAFSIKIYSDQSSRPHLPVATVFSGTSGTARFSNNFGFERTSKFSDLEAELIPDELYWLVIENRSANDLWIGHTSREQASTRRSAGLTGVDWNITVEQDIGWRIEGVPEPTATSLLIASLALLGTQGRFRNRFGRSIAP